MTRNTAHQRMRQSITGSGGASPRDVNGPGGCRRAIDGRHGETAHPLGRDAHVPASLNTAVVALGDHRFRPRFDDLKPRLIPIVRISRELPGETGGGVARPDGVAGQRLRRGRRHRRCHDQDKRKSSAADPHLTTLSSRMPPRAFEKRTGVGAVTQTTLPRYDLAIRECPDASSAGDLKVGRFGMPVRRRTTKDGRVEEGCETDRCLTRLAAVATRHFRSIPPRPCSCSPCTWPSRPPPEREPCGRHRPDRLDPAGIARRAGAPATPG